MRITYEQSDQQYIDIPDVWLWDHYIKYSEVIAALVDSKLTGYYRKFTLSLSLVDDISIPGIDFSTKDWDFVTLGLPTLTWVADTVLEDFEKCFIIDKKLLVNFWESLNNEEGGSHTWKLTDHYTVIPLASENMQQYLLNRKGEYLYPGGFSKQPLQTLVYSKALTQVESIYKKISSNKKRQEHKKDHSIYDGLSSLDLDLIGYLENG